ncbi:MAG: YceI family protein [Polyangiaceae bacterium]|nr:YceI family protein [Polyangiaceae bacterium]
MSDQDTTWAIDTSHSSVSFSVRHMMISNVKGEFERFSGAARFSADAPERASVEVDIELASIDTRDAKRDAHLRSADFFDTETHPKMTFRSTAVRRAGDGLAVDGDLTIKGVTRKITLAVDGPTAAHADPWGNQRVGASATATIKRSEFGITWNTALEAGGVLVGDDVKISIDVSLVKQKA